jgi:5,10-methenyltetrahydrofolate synthetase
MNGDKPTTKQDLRARIQARLGELALEDRAVRSRVICERVAELPVWKNARVVALFEAMDSEPQIELLVDELRRRGSEIIFILPSARRHEDVPIASVLDLVLVPGVAFTRDGRRLGRGAGFFDRFLAHRAQRAVKIGVCFNFQIVDSLVVETHDVKVDLVVTD